VIPLGVAEAPVRLGVDLGGTGTRIVALTESDEITGETIAATKDLGDGRTSSPVERLVELLCTVAGGHRVRGVGIGASGPIDSDGIVRNHDTLALFSDIPLVSTVSDRLGVPCAIDSDAVTFALGEYGLGAGRCARTLIGVTFGTGIGVCVLHDGRPHRGGDGLHPELGHLPVPGGPAPCYCGLNSCWEQLASRAALEERVAETGFFDIRVAAAAAVEGDDPSARELFDRYGRAVGIGLATLCTSFRPDRVVIGGGVAPYLDLFAGGIHSALHRNPPYETDPEIRAAELGAVAGAVGAATLTNPAET
jgi:glucokinase